MKTTSRVRWIANTLRVLAIVLVIAGASSLLPKVWIDSVLVSFRLGAMPDEALVRYVHLGTGYLAVSLAVMLWIAATDVVRYRPFVAATTAIFLVGAPTFYWMNVAAGMPSWCGIVDFVCCLLGGGILLALLISPPDLSPNQVAANRRPAGQSDGSGNLSAIVAADRAFPAGR